MLHEPIGDIEAVKVRPLSELAYELIVDRIVRLQLPPGTALVEKTLMEDLELGRTPIREALQRLTIEGLVCRTHYRGVYVCEVTADSIERVAEFRMMTDPVIARYAAMRGTEIEVAELETSVEQMRARVGTQEFDAYTRASRNFYTTLATATRNLHFEDAAGHIYNFDARLLYLAARSEGEWQALAVARLENAQLLVDCIRRRAAAEAEAGTRLYLVRYFERVMQLMGTPRRSAAGRLDGEPGSAAGAGTWYEVTRETV